MTTNAATPRTLALIIGLALGPVPATAALAEAADVSVALEPAFGNTIVSTHPDGRQAKLWLNRDGTYTAQGRRGQFSGGNWRLTSGKLCLTQSTPYPIPFFSYCKVVPHIALGGVWSDVAVTGEHVTNRLVAGR